MKELLFLLPTLFLAICLSFIIVQSCYQRWKLHAILHKKREAAKISLVNILQMTNTTSPRLPVVTSTETRNHYQSHHESGNNIKKSSVSNSEVRFDPRSPNLLSSVVTMKDEIDNSPPPCYEDLYGSTFTFSPNPPPPPPAFPRGPQEDCCHSHHRENSIANALHNGEIRNPSGNETCCLNLQLPPSTERRNSSAILYL